MSNWLGIAAAAICAAAAGVTAPACGASEDPPRVRTLRGGNDRLHERQDRNRDNWRWDEKSSEWVREEQASLDPDEATFWVWRPANQSQLPDFETEAYWFDERVFPIIVTLVDRPDGDWQNAPGVGGQGKDTPYDLVDSPEGKNPEASARQVVGWADWYRDQFRDELGRENFKYLFWLNGLGAPPWPGDDLTRNRRNTWTLGRNPADALDGDANDRALVGSWFMAEGIALNSDWAERFFRELDAARRSESLPPPAALHFDLEGIFDEGELDEWWPLALEDRRAYTERVDGRNTLARLARRAPRFYPERGTYARANKPFLNWRAGVALEIEDYVLWEALWRHAREIWPEIPLSNYNMVPASSVNPVPLPKMGSTIAHAELRYATHAAPILYRMRDYAFEGGRVTPADHIRRYGGTPTGDADRDLVLANYLAAKARLDAAIESGMPVAPWIMSPTPELDLEHTAMLIRHGLEHGVRDWLLFSSENYDWGELIAEVDRQLAAAAD